MHAERRPKISPRHDNLKSLQIDSMKSLICLMLAWFPILAQVPENERFMKHPTFYRTIQIDGLSIFYREAGPKEFSTAVISHWTLPPMRSPN